MITPEEESIGRLHGLRQIVKSGNRKAVKALTLELQSLATDKVENVGIKQGVVEVLASVTETFDGEADAGEIDALVAKIESAIESLDQLCQAEDDFDEFFVSEAAEPVGEVEIDPQMLSVFIREAGEHLDNAESSLLILEQEPDDAEAINSVFRGFHSVKGNASFLGLAIIGQVAHEAETLFEFLRAGNAELSDAIADLALRSVDGIRDMVCQLEDEGLAGDRLTDKTSQLLDELKQAVTAIESGAEVTPNQGANALPPVKKVPSTPQNNAAESSRPKGAKSKAEKTSKASSGRQATSGVIRVDQDRLDELINLIGELVIAESIVAASNEADGSASRAEQPLIQLNKITRELQQLSLSLRMVPINDLFQKQFRLIRDLSRKLQKPAELVIEGGATELDKNVIDQLADPLVHIVRNSIDHGIEPSLDERRQAGKPDTATVTLGASYEGGQIRISIKDDGRGLNRQRILAKAISKGVIDESQELEDSQIDQLIFDPGLSTAETITDLSGRGVGMDVVARNIESLRGSVRVQSTPGKGTEIIITLPMTLAIIDGLVVVAGDHRFVLPAHEVERLIEIDQHTNSNIARRQPLLDVQGRNIPLFDMDKVVGFNLDRPPIDGNVAVLVRCGDHAFGLRIDRVVCRQQVVIKQLGDAIGLLEGFAGGAVMADGQVALIVDVAGVQQRLRRSRLPA